MKGRLCFSSVRKVYRWRGSRVRSESVKGALLGGWWRRRRPSEETHTALDGIDLELQPGDAVALVGPNGSGKSTLLKLAGKIFRPTEGTVEVEGRVTALIELGAGFHPEITGRENVIINGMLLGLDRREVESRLPEILRFAGIGDFIDQPVKTYSSGMYVRLGFAVAVAVDPDILLIDEVLSVGDEAFTRRLQFAVDFPFPEEGYRMRIWETLFPADVPRDPEVDFGLLARRFKLAGGSIRNVIVGAAYLAAADGGRVKMGHLLHSTRRELQKMGRLVDEADMRVGSGE